MTLVFLLTKHVEGDLGIGGSNDHPKYLQQRGAAQSFTELEQSQVGFPAPENPTYRLSSILAEADEIMLWVRFMLLNSANTFGSLVHMIKYWSNAG